MRSLIISFGRTKKMFKLSLNQTVPLVREGTLPLCQQASHLHRSSSLYSPGTRPSPPGNIHVQKPPGRCYTQPG